VGVPIIKLNESAIRRILNSAAVRRDMVDRAERMAEAAGGAPDFEVLEGTTDRAIAVVITATTEGRRAEAESRALTRAIDAGR
jgi:hypothetical protein